MSSRADLKARAEALLAADLRLSAFEVTATDAGLSVVATGEERWFAERRREAQEAICARMLRQWRFVYDRSYLAEGAPKAPNFDVWISGFTNTPIAPDAMQVWLADVLAQLRAVSHRRVLDVGSGSGLVMAELAADAQIYHGLDLSEQAIASLSAWVATQPSLRHVRLAQGAAHDLEEREGEPVDLVILNSVVQYFPDAAYLIRVLQAGAAQLRPGGSIFLGDLRADGLLPMRAVNVAAARAPPDATVRDVRARARRILDTTGELSIDPGFFCDLDRSVSRLGSVQFSLKPKEADRELAGYRYDAMLRLDTPGGQLAPIVDAARPEEIAARLREARPDCFAVLGRPNARLAPDVFLLHALEAAAPDDLLQTAMLAAEPPDPTAIEPDDLRRVAEAAGYQVELRFTPNAADGRFDALFFRRGQAAQWPKTAARPPLTNDPLASELAAQLTAELRASLETGLGGARLASLNLVRP